MKQRFASVLLVLLMLGGAAWALEDNLSDFMFENMVDTWRESSVNLYPELNVERNPSVALDVDRILLFPALDLDIFNFTDDVETIPEPLANAGGTETTTEKYFDFRDTGASGYIPLDGNMVVGGALFGGLFNYNREVVDANFSFANETITRTYQDKFNQLIIGGLFAIGLDALDLGVAARYERYGDPAEEEFEWIAGDPGADETYTTNLGSTGSTQNVIEAIAGTRLVQDALEFGIGAGFTVDTITWDEYQAVDTDADGYRDTVVPYEEYATSTEAWGLGFSFYDSKDETRETVVALYPHLLYELSDPLTLVASGYWFPISSSVVTFYERTAETDESITTSTTDSGLANFGLLTGVEWRPVNRLELRTGLGYEFSRWNYYDEILDATGTSTYDANNTGNYAEDALGGVEPQEDDVVSNGSRVSSTRQRVSILTGAMWNPVPRIRFYSDADFNIAFEKDEYKLYDTTAGDVWTETDESNDLDWSANVLVGFAFQMNDSLTLGMEISNRVVSRGDRGRSTDSLPTGPDGVTNNPGGNLIDTGDGRFSINLFLIVGL
ncbi:MAG: hypothetical protein ACOC8L_09170 [Spirochaetota bacterium]